MSRNISASGQLTWNTPVDGLSFIGKVGMNYWTKYDKAYRADTYFDDSKTVGPATLNVWTANNTYTTFEALATYEKQIKIIPLSYWRVLLWNNLIIKVWKVIEIRFLIIICMN